MRNIVLNTALVSCAAFAASDVHAQAFIEAERLDVVRNVVRAVETQDPDLYVSGFAPDVVIRLYDGEVRIAGRDAMRANRAAHFERFPDVTNTLVHLVAIDDRVIMHDRVHSNPDVGEPRDIVEVFTFENGWVTVVDVTQPHDLFSLPQ